MTGCGRQCARPILCRPPRRRRTQFLETGKKSWIPAGACPRAGGDGDDRRGCCEGQRLVSTRSFPAGACPRAGGQCARPILCRPPRRRRTQFLETGKKSWIPAFAGMTGCGRQCARPILCRPPRRRRTQFFETGKKELDPRRSLSPPTGPRAARPDDKLRRGRG